MPQAVTIHLCRHSRGKSMMNTPEYIRERLELYLRGELDTSQAAGVAELIRTDPEWKNIHRQMVIEQQGIRLNHLKLNRQSLQDLEVILTNQEKKIHSEGDLSAPSTLSHRSNDSDGTEVKTEARDMEEETIDPANQHGIRYSNLRSVLSELKEEEKKRPGSAGSSKSVSTGRGMRRIWLGAIAAGLAALIFFSWPWIRPRTYAEKLIADGFVVPPMTDLVRGGEELDSIQMIVQKAYGAYAEGDYKLALKYFEMIGYLNDSHYCYYYFITSLLTGTHNQAKSLADSLTLKWPELKLRTDFIN